MYRMKNEVLVQELVLSILRWVLHLFTFITPSWVQGKKMFWQEFLDLNETPPVLYYFHKVILVFVQSWYCPCLLDAVCLQCLYALLSLCTACTWLCCSLSTDAGSWWPWLCWEKWATQITKLSGIEKVILKLYCQRERMPVSPSCALTSFNLILLFL